MIIYPSFLQNYLFDTRKIIIMRKHKKLKRYLLFKKIIFALFLLQKVKFEEIRKNCSYIIIYKLSYIMRTLRK